MGRHACSSHACQDQCRQSTLLTHTKLNRPSRTGTVATGDESTPLQCPSPPAAAAKPPRATIAGAMRMLHAVLTQHYRYCLSVAHLVLPQTRLHYRHPTRRVQRALTQKTRICWIHCVRIAGSSSTPWNARPGCWVHARPGLKSAWWRCCWPALARHHARCCMGWG